MRKSQRTAAAAAAWRAAREPDRPGSPGLGERLAALPRTLRAGLGGEYPGLGKGKVLLYLVALIYVVSPIDALPEMLVPFLGFADDVGLAVWLTTSALSESGQYLEWERRQGRVVQGRAKRVEPDGPEPEQP
ncbi:YkvA family protein [Allonocardiopsis opalescens]|uniref:Uncharacterized membrane protein YkvA (DUF1232 family) n=1 Tax=Allonocardiopsis opalescens TaxID=1144618 RepID=A0A2T0QAT2_9ACTN|nr:YkvA family protein [Allonocardiopsis opalescens]PRY00920.1 uncharacterized membrane protein YkvA (DUF1232 family) [Allonocardiopsis opalescens]